MRSRLRFKFCLFHLLKNFSQTDPLQYTSPITHQSHLPFPLHPASPHPAPRAVHLASQISHEPVCFLSVSTMVTGAHQHRTQNHCTTCLTSFLFTLWLFSTVFPHFIQTRFSRDQGTHLLETQDYLLLLHINSTLAYKVLQGQAPLPSPATFSLDTPPPSFAQQTYFRCSHTPSSLLH